MLSEDDLESSLDLLCEAAAGPVEGVFGPASLTWRVDREAAVFLGASRDDGDGEFDRFFARVRKGDRDCNIEPPASPYAIMRRVHPYRGENSGPGKDDHWRA